MSEQVIVRCPNCDTRFKVAMGRLGRVARCRNCAGEFELVAYEPELPRVMPPALPPSAPARTFSNRTASSFPRISMAGVRKAMNVPVQGVLFKVGIGVFFLLMTFGIIMKVIGLVGPGESGKSLFGTPSASVPPLQFSQEGSYSVGRATVKNYHAKSTDVRLYLPPGQHLAGSLPCVFICPAGSNLLMGTNFDREEYESFFPLCQRGVAVCFYSLDGSLSNPRGSSDYVVERAMKDYAAASGGLDNLADAIDTVLAGAKMIDPGRLGTCGHSSAGTIAIAGLAHEPRIVTAAAMAPCVDLPRRFGSSVMIQLPSNITRMIDRLSPSNVSRFDHPLFIYETRDDENTPASEAEAFAAKHPRDVTLKLGNTGGHSGAFFNGSAYAFDFLAKTLKANGAGAAASDKSSAEH